MAMDRTASLLLIPLIIAIVVIIGLIAAVVVMEGDYEIKDREISKQKAERENINKKFANAESARVDLARFIAGREEEDIEMLRRRWLQGGPDNDELQRYKLSSTDARQRFETLTDVYRQLFQERFNCLQAAKRAIDEQELAKNDYLKAQEGFAEVKSDLEKEKQALIEEKSRIEKDFEKYRIEKTAEIAQITKTLDDLRAAKDEERKKFEMDAAALYSKISELEQRIKVLTPKPPQTLMSCDPDGEIILADNKLGNAYIDLMRRDGLRVGMIFDVFRYIKGGRTKTKGKIEVKVVNDDKPSQVAIIECLEPEDDPIVKGDYIISPLFDKKKVRIFVFAGELVNPLYTKYEVTKKIQEMGAKVAPEVTVETDFLVAGKGAEETEQYPKAIQLGVIIMREEELLRYIGR
jgi:hypothetical protein